MELIWTQEALERLEDIQYYLTVGQKAPVVAKEMLHRLQSRTLQIQSMPLSGKQVPNYEDPTVREKLESPDLRD